MYFRKNEFENEIVSKRGGGRKMGEVSFQRSDCETLGEIFICLKYANRFYGTKQIP